MRNSCCVERRSRLGPGRPSGSGLVGYSPRNRAGVASFSPSTTSTAAGRGFRLGLLAAPMTAVDFPPHITVTHPRTSNRGEECQAALTSRPVALEFTVREVLFTETTAHACDVLRRFAPAG
jgi:hypothetical protein